MRDAIPVAAGILAFCLVVASAVVQPPAVGLIYLVAALLLAAVALFSIMFVAGR